MKSEENLNVQEQEIDVLASVEGTESVLSFDAAIKKLITDGGVRRNNLTIKNVKVTDKNSYTQVSLSLVPKVDGFIADENDVFSKGKTDVIFTSSFAISGTFKQDSELSILANGIVSKPETINYLVNGGTVDIIQLEVPAGVEYINPFSSNSSPVTFDHDVIINHCVKFTLGKGGKIVLDRLADRVAEAFL